jgi:hypothetical protein
VTLTNTDETRVRKCIFALNSTKLKGKVLKLELAKPEFQVILKERQKSDLEVEKDRAKTATERRERRSKAKLLPATKPGTAASVDGEDFVPSNPYGWVKVKGRYVPIVRLGRKGRDGGLLVEPKTYAHNIQGILCYVKDLKCNKILTEMPSTADKRDEAAKLTKRGEVDRWVQGIIKQRIAMGDAIADYSTFFDDDEEGPMTKKKATRRDENQKNRKAVIDDEFEVVEGDGGSEDDYVDGSSASFSDIEELMDKKSKKADPTKKAASASSSDRRKYTEPEGGDKTRMLSVIASILKTKTGSDYGDDDSQDFDLNPTSGESSETEEVETRNAQSDSDLQSSSEDEYDESDSESISAKSFDDGSDNGDGKVVDFDSDDAEEAVHELNGYVEMNDSFEGDPAVLSSNSATSDEHISDASSVSEPAIDMENDSFEGEFEVSSSSSVSVPVGDAGSESDSASSSSSHSVSSFADSSPIQVPIQPITTSKTVSAKSDYDDDDDINIHIIATGPKSASKSSSKMDIDENEEASQASSDEEGEEFSSTANEKKRSRVWSADLMEANKKYAYSELVREEDEKIFAMMRDAPTSDSKVGFKFLPNRPTLAPVALPPVIIGSSSHHPSQDSATTFSSSSSFPTAPLTKVDAEQKAKMFLFGLSGSKRSPTSKSGEPPVSAPAASAASSSSFVRSTQVDKIHKMWSGTKDFQRQLAQRNHKLASKRVKAQGRF